MKAKILFYLFCCTTFASFGQADNGGTDFRSTEDAINKLINNVNFLDKLGKMSSEQLTNITLQSWIDEYLPEYKGFKANVNTIDHSKIYYASQGKISNEQLAGFLGKATGMKQEDVSKLQFLFSGSFTPEVSANYLANQWTGSLYEKGKNKQVDLVVDNTNQALQKKYGDGGAGSAIINMGTNVLGYLIFPTDQQSAPQVDSAALKEMEAMRILKGEFTTAEKDLEQNQKAHEIAKAGGDYEKAITLFNGAIDAFRGNPSRGSYLFQAYLDRARCKMMLKNYRGATIDYYFAQVTLQKLLSGELPRNEWVKISPQAMLCTYISRAYSKNKSQDYSGSLSDCSVAEEELKKLSRPKYDAGNDFSDAINGIRALNYFGMQRYAESASLFSTSSLVERSIYGFDEATPMIAMFNHGIPKAMVLDYILIKGHAYYRNNQLDDAIKHYGKTVSWIYTRNGGDYSVILTSLANFYLLKNDASRALKNYNDAINLSPENPSYYMNRANCFMMMGDTIAANEDLEAAKNPEQMKTRKKDISYYQNKVTQLEAEKKTSELTDLLFEAAKTYPEKKYKFFEKFMELISETADAEKMLAFAKKTPDSLSYYMCMTLYYSIKKDEEKEIEYMYHAFNNKLTFSQAEKAFPGFETSPYYCHIAIDFMNHDNNPLYDTGMCRIFTKNLEDALKNPNPSEITVNIHAVFACRPELALEYAGKGVYAKYPTPNIIKEKILLYFILQRPAEAVKEAQKFYKKNSKEYEGKKEEDFEVIKNIAQNHCGL